MLKGLVYRLWMIAYGLAHIATGLVTVGSLGFYCPGWHQKVSLAMARWYMQDRKG